MDVAEHAFLDLAKRKDFDGVLRELAKKPRLVNVSVCGRWTALHQAAQTCNVQAGNVQVVQSLLEFRANVAEKNRSGHTPQQVAEHNGHIAVADMLRAAQSIGDGHAAVADTLRAAQSSGDTKRSYLLCLHDIIGHRPLSATVEEEVGSRADWCEDWSRAVEFAAPTSEWAAKTCGLELTKTEASVLYFYDSFLPFLTFVNEVVHSRRHDSGLNETLFTLFSVKIKLMLSSAPRPAQMFYKQYTVHELMAFLGVGNFSEVRRGLRTVLFKPSEWSTVAFHKDDHLLLKLHGKAADDMIHMPFPPCSVESTLPSSTAVLGPLTAMLVLSDVYFDEALQARCLDVSITFSPQLLGELIRPNAEVWKAVSIGDNRVVRDWLVKYPVMDLEHEHTVYECSILYSACRFGALGAVKALVEACAQINSQLSSAKSTPLHAAAHFDHPEIVKFLLENLADPTLRNGLGFTPLEEAGKKTASMVIGLAAPPHAANHGLKLVAQARELRYGSRSGFIHGLEALVGTPVLTLTEEWQGRPGFTWTNRYGSNTAGKVWQDAAHHFTDRGLLEKPESKDASLTREEVLACVLYTGDGFTPLNEWLRALGLAVEAGRYDEVRHLQSNEKSWTSSVLTIASAMQKLVAINKDCPPLFRGIQGKLPDEFFIPDERGMVSVTEYGFMSTSRATDVTDTFGGDNVSVIMNIAAKGEDACGYHNGVDLEWLTMHPGEQETLFPPGTFFNIEKRHRQGLRITLSIRPTFLL